ncbi:unnamed protein product [Dibothriocephalus latus]|uniref:Uncharacterized protein n=1 Tax=Dibothriocephalus latus TaxID=60516 RepID=A0A3P7LBH7_DIBLA|nr:unnamed protein product [Dibothriocephalus latus]
MQRGWIASYFCDLRAVDPSTPPLDFLFSRGRCAPGFYEYHSSCVALIPAAGLLRLPSPQHDDVTNICLQSTGTNCSDPLGTSECPILDAPDFLESTTLLNFSVRSILSQTTNPTLCVSLNVNSELLQAIPCDQSLRALCGYFLGTSIDDFCSCLLAQ